MAVGHHGARLARVAIYIGLVVIALMLGSIFIIGGNILATPFLIAALVWMPREPLSVPRDLAIRTAIGTGAVLLGVIAMLLSVALTESVHSVAVVASGPLLWLASLVQLAMYVLAVIVGLLLVRPRSTS